MRLITKVTLLILTLCSSGLQATEEIEKVSDFFNKYMKLANSYDLSVLSLYADDAKIHTLRTYPHGIQRNLEMTGKQWKQLVSKTIDLAKSQNDRSTMSNVKISKQGTGFKIKADRYSHKKCYTDKDYYLVIEPDLNGSYVIIEEFTATQPNSNC